MQIESLNHLVLTVRDIETTVEFYVRVMGMEAVTFGQGRKALQFGQQKINLHPQGQSFEPKAQNPLLGSADLCFVTQQPIEAIARHLNQCSVAIIEGPVSRTGAIGPIVSVYFRDPDLNLIEVCRYLSPGEKM
ncbi:MAG: VOC family protein [Leptolyngbyaceae cyanobacterium SM1_1_3]|nr:VOC family protein [Leptolyngbyaceae cyanobacterium SM1_1_3]NJN03675.1 VOC family protein [Leptolyngbyaceae cyanobacterium RM1_1_2]NJO09138.1 VOC family protein [Leptolyngbyaceae cyanobacterium SL_1_1]